MNLTEEEINAFNIGLKQAQWQITKALLGLGTTDVLDARTKRILKFIYDEIEKEKK